MFLNVLASGQGDYSWIFLVVLVGAMVLMMVFNRRSQKKRQEEQMNTLNAVKPGNKVKTIGGICGVVVEICDEDNTFVLETGTEKSGKSYIKFDKQAIYQTDAVAPKAVPAPAEEPMEGPVEEAPVETQEKADEEPKAE